MTTFADLALGQHAAVSKTITRDDIRAFTALVGDDNPIHHDEAFAASTRFGGVIGHGMLTAGLLSTLLGTKLPGTGTVYMGQTLRFTAPVRPGDTITATAEVVELFPETRRVRIGTRCVNQRGETVLDGEALMLMLA